MQVCLEKKKKTFTRIEIKNESGCIYHFLIAKNKKKKKKNIMGAG